VRRRVKGADYPAVTPSSEENEVRGTLVTGLTDGDVWRLDIFEGSEYERRDVRVMVLGKEGEEVEAQTYIWVAGEQRLEAQEWDFEHFVREKMGRWVGEEVEDEGFKGMFAFCGERGSEMESFLTKGCRCRRCCEGAPGPNRRAWFEWGYYKTTRERRKRGGEDAGERCVSFNHNHLALRSTAQTTQEQNRRA
jgi:hypothetical protein